MEKKALIISLIRDDLTNSSLINGLNKMGLNADHYTLHLSTTIFDLLGIKKHDPIAEGLLRSYLEMTTKATEYHENSKTSDLDGLSNEIYEALLNAKQTFF